MKRRREAGRPIASPPAPASPVGAGTDPPVPAPAVGADSGLAGPTPPIGAGRRHRAPVRRTPLRRAGWRRAAGLLLAVLAVLAVPAGGAVVLDRLFPPDLSRLSATGTEIVDRQGRLVALRPAQGGIWRLRVTADDVSPVLLEILVATEDRRFWHHFGIDPVAIARAALSDLRAGRIVSGGSTLTMQAARLLEPRPRTWRSKVLEIARALQLEAHFTKRDILGIWLTLAPMGGNLEGVRAGSLAWFGAEPRLLDPAQAALLVAIPRRPEALRPDRHAERARLLRDRILAAMDHGEGGAPAPLTLAAAAILDAGMPRARQPMPRHAMPAFAGMPAGPHPSDLPTGALPPGTRVVTTLDLPLQLALERLAAERLATLPPRVSLALLIADARTREVLAIVPGDPRGGEARAAALDLTRAVRSPGSALKPFIYGLAFQDGRVGPETVLDDLPRRFGGYAPENFDHGFHGVVTAADALRRSLNLPAVALLDRVGPLRFLEALRVAGVPLVLPRHAAPSLPLALGGGGITLRQAAGLYAALATDGQMAALRLFAGQPLDTRPFLDPRAAATVADVLTQRLPDRGQSGIAWKTGTSWGGRDAWALGFDRRHVVGVWVGRPDGTAIPAATGLSLAVPLLSHVFDLLPPAPRAAPPPALTAPALTAPIGLAGQAAPRSDALHLLFPPDRAVLSDAGAVTLRTMGGRRPLTFLVDGTPLDSDAARREASWLPPSPGFYRITVVDADGAAAQASVRVR
jgi:penicillin-binding protein 1C